MNFKLWASAGWIQNISYAQCETDICCNLTFAVRSRLKYQMVSISVHRHCSNLTCNATTLWIHANIPLLKGRIGRSPILLFLFWFSSSSFSTVLLVEYYRTILIVMCMPTSQPGYNTLAPFEKSSRIFSVHWVWLSHTHDLHLSSYLTEGRSVFRESFSCIGRKHRWRAVTHNGS